MNNDEIKRFLKWGGDFPAPFKDQKPNSGVFSKYTTDISGIVPTNRISSTAVQFLVDMYNENTQYAIGNTVNQLIVEKHDTINNKYLIGIYDSNNHESFAFEVDIDTNDIQEYDDERNYYEPLMLMTIWEELSQDEEFFSNYSSFVEYMNKSNIEEAWKNISVLCDNIYRRLKDDLITITHSKISLEDIKKNIISGVYIPSGPIMNSFLFLKESGDNELVETIPLEKFVGQYPIDKDRVYTEEEKTLMDGNKLEDYYIVGEDDIEICNDIVKTTNMKKPFRTFTLVGPPGTGKSHKTKAISNAVVLPHVVFTCNPSTEIFDLIGQVMPPDMDDLEKDSWDFASKVEELGGLNFKNIAKIFNLPTVEDIVVCPEIIYEDITGNKLTSLGKKPTVNDTLKAWTVYMTDIFNQSLRRMTVAMKTGTGFKFTETDFIKAVEKGWSAEIQEPNVILNEGVLVGLNSILNEGVITLQNGKQITRHRDSLIFFTTNFNLNGLRNMNQSFLDRSSEIFYVKKPDKNVVADRVISISGNTDRKLVMQMCEFTDKIQTAMEKEGIDDGICGMRSIINWAIKSTYTNPYDAAIKTLINKASLDDYNRQKLQRKLDESFFYQYKKI